MSKIPLYTQTTHDWHCNKNQQKKPLAVDLNVGTNEYIFGRVTPNNKFVVSTGLINDPKPYGVQMVGGKKKMRKNKKGGKVMGSEKPNLSVYDQNNFQNNELIFNALDKINKLNGLNSPCKNSMINAQNNIVGGKRKVGRPRKLKGGQETLGATPMPLKYYNAKMPSKATEVSSVKPNDSAVKNLATYSKVGRKKKVGRPRKLKKEKQGKKQVKK